MGILDKLFGKNGDGSTEANIAQQKKYAQQLQDAYANNSNSLNGLMGKMQGLADNYSVNVDNDIKASNENFENSRDDMNSYLANMGFTPQSNNTFAKNNAVLSNQKANMEANLRNQANREKFNVQNGMYGNLANLTNQLYNNQLGSLGGANGALTNAYNAQSAYWNNSRNNNMQLAGGALNTVGSIASGGMGGGLGGAVGGLFGGLGKMFG